MIAKIEYDYGNNPVRIQFTNANVTKYVYSATGEKLRVIYQTSVYPEDADIVNPHCKGNSPQMWVKNEYHCDYAETFKLTLFYGKN